VPEKGEKSRYVGKVRARNKNLFVINFWELLGEVHSGRAEKIRCSAKDFPFQKEMGGEQKGKVGGEGSVFLLAYFARKTKLNLTCTRGYWRTRQGARKNVSHTNRGRNRSPI